MKQLIFIFSLLSFFLKAQNFELKDDNLIKYYKIINQAESNIINNNLDSANLKYKQAFIIFKEPHAKDLNNSMKVALKVNDTETSYNNYLFLKCLGQNFNDDFFSENFKNQKKDNAVPCTKTIDLQYKKTLDSLVEIDQYYRKLSNGNYQAYKKELTRGDSITSINLLKLIQKKGFPNEYNIGLKMNSIAYYHDFYLIIWHQLASNLYSPQRVNFSNEIIKALNTGKIRPDIAGQLLDLNNNTRDYSYFRIYQFGNGDGTMDCCYISENLMPENRNDKVKSKIEYVNKKRKEIGLSTTEDELRKSIFYLKNKDYIFSENVLDGWIFKNPKDTEKFKIGTIKINDTSH